jgi:UDP-glucose 4-epimerase
MKVLVTGACGFIGVNLVKYLLEKSHIVRAFDNLSVGSEKNLENACKGFDLPELFVGDVRDMNAVEESINTADAVVHLGAHTNVVDSLQKPEEYFQTNAQGTFNILEACRKNRVTRFVYASSNAVVGDQEPPITEKMIPRPLSPYGASKLVGEVLCSAYYNSYEINAISLRFSNAYGPYSFHKESVVAEFIRRVKEGKALIIYGDGQQTRDFIHTWDVCNAIYLSLNSRCGGEVFQIATGIETKVTDLAKLIFKLAESHGYPLPEIKYLEQRKGEITRNFSDISKVKKILGFEPEMKLENGLKDFFK